jgi:hypothetical protein
MVCKTRQVIKVSFILVSAANSLDAAVGVAASQKYHHVSKRSQQRTIVYIKKRRRLVVKCCGKRRCVAGAVQKIINGTRQTKIRRHPKQTTARKPKQPRNTAVPGTSRGQHDALAESTRGEEMAPDQATEAATGAPPGNFIFSPQTNFLSMLCMFMQLAEVVPQKILKSLPEQLPPMPQQ